MSNSFRPYEKLEGNRTYWNLRITKDLKVRAQLIAYEAGVSPAKVARDGIEAEVDRLESLVSQGIDPLTGQNYEEWLAEILTECGISPEDVADAVAKAIRSKPKQTKKESKKKGKEGNVRSKVEGKESDEGNGSSV